MTYGQDKHGVPKGLTEDAGFLGAQMNGCDISDCIEVTMCVHSTCCDYNCGVQKCCQSHHWVMMACLAVVSTAEWYACRLQELVPWRQEAVSWSAVSCGIHVRGRWVLRGAAAVGAVSCDVA